MRIDARAIGRLLLMLYPISAYADAPRLISGGFREDARSAVRSSSPEIVAIEAGDRSLYTEGAEIVRSRAIHVSIPTGDFERLCIAVHGEHELYLANAAFDIAHTPPGRWILPAWWQVDLAVGRNVLDARVSSRCDDLFHAPHVLVAWTAEELDCCDIRVYVDSDGRDSSLRFLESRVDGRKTVKAFECTKAPDGGRRRTFDTECVADLGKSVHHDSGWVSLSIRGAADSRAAFELRF